LEDIIMSEVSVQIKHQAIGYNKTEVKMLLKKMEALLQERAMTIDAMQQQITGLEAKLEQATTPEAVEAAEKIELYDKLMKKMDGDFRNLLAPAQAKAKSIEEKAIADYELRMSQAREAADGIYAMAADRIADVVDANMDRMYGLLDDFIYSKSLRGRFEAFCDTCNAASMKVASGIVAAAKLPGKAVQAVSDKVKDKIAEIKGNEDTYDYDLEEEYEL
jgi:cell division septum initiation protein DivIVA